MMFSFEQQVRVMALAKPSRHSERTSGPAIGGRKGYVGARATHFKAPLSASPHAGRQPAGTQDERPMNRRFGRRSGKLR